MATFRDRLAALLHSEKVRVLAQYTPLGLVAAVSGTIIGAAVGAPAFAAAGLGMVLTGLATNLTSSLIYDAIRPDADDDTRSTAIQRALEAHDPQVTVLVAEVLAALGPQLADALATAAQPRLLPALSSGMRQAGGLLAAQEGAISAALADPHADWSALQQRIARHITSVDMSAETSDTARVTNQEQRVDNAAGPVKISAKASGNSVMEGGKQIVTGMGGRASGSAPIPGAPAPTSDPQHARELLAATIARLEVRELQRAQYGIDAPPHVVTELEALRAEVARLRALLGV